MFVHCSSYIEENPIIILSDNVYGLLNLECVVSPGLCFVVHPHASDEAAFLLRKLEGGLTRVEVGVPPSSTSASECRGRWSRCTVPLVGGGGVGVAPLGSV